MPETFHYDPPANPWIAILHRDHDLLVLDKPAGLLTVAGKTPDLADCLEARVQAVYPTATIVHRLDRATSGVMVMALNPAAHRFLARGFEVRRTEKTYYAIVTGHVAEDDGTIDLPLKTDWPNRPKQKVDHEDGRTAITHWQVKERRADGHTLMKLKPVTGRSHQLRVHMRELGHPILGDAFYGDGGAADRLMLHAAVLSFIHPASRETLRFEVKTSF